MYSQDLFRIVYNGVPQIVPGCADQTLCGVDKLLSAMDYKGITPCLGSESTETSEYDSKLTGPYEAMQFGGTILISLNQKPS